MVIFVIVPNPNSSKNNNLDQQTCRQFMHFNWICQSKAMNVLWLWVYYSSINSLISNLLHEFQIKWDRKATS